MKRLPLRLAALVVLPAVLGLATATHAASEETPPPPSGFYGPCPGYGPGMGAGWGMKSGRGAGWQGMGPAARGGAWPGAYWADADRDGTLTVDEVKAFLEVRHNRPGFENLKVGTVKEKDDATLTAEIVTAEGALVRTLEFPRKVEAIARPARRGGAGYGPAMRSGRGGYGPAMRGGRGGWNQAYGPARQARFDGRAFGPGMRAGLLADGELSVGEVRGLMESRLARWNNPNVKVGDVAEKDDAVIVAEIVTQDGSLVERITFDRKTGFPIRNR